MKNLLSTLLVLCISTISIAQTGVYKYAYFKDVDVTENGRILEDPWVGGLNNPQFNALDVNFDCHLDLIIFDRDGQNLRVYINDTIPGEDSYHYAPEYAKFFPSDVNDWLLIRDFNNDGKGDLFTNNTTINNNGNGIKVYKNISDSILKFELITDHLPAWYGSNPSTVFVRAADIPAIEDIDNDGDLDIVAQAQIALSYQYYENRTTSPDSFDLHYNEQCWGHFYQWFDGTVNLNFFCKSGGSNSGNASQRDGGYTILTIDLNNDGLKEAIIGDPDRSNMIMLENGGTPTTAHMVDVTYDFPYPKADSVNITSFPAAFYEDVNNNNTKDLIVAPNQYLGCIDTGTVWQYINYGLETLPSFHLEKKNFLGEHQIDVGTMAIPTFVDVSGDSIPDMLIGNMGYFVSFDPSSFIRTYKSQIAYYKNTGTATKPIYDLVTRDYVSASLRNLTRISPTYGDLDGDGDIDMLFGELNGNISYYENIAPIGAEASFLLRTETFMNQTFGVNPSPFLMDIDKDGLIDLLVGQKNGNIHLYLNQGSSSSPLYSTSITDTLGGVYNYEPGYDNSAVPFVGKLNGDTTNVLIVGTYNGWLKFYTGLDDDFLGSFTLKDSIKVSGGPIAPTGINLNMNDSLELIIGERSGGLIAFHMDTEDYNYSPYPRDTCANDTTVGIENIPSSNVSFDIYPNPNNGEFVLKFKDSQTGTGTVSIYDLSGKMLISKSVSLIDNQNEISFHHSDLTQGVYIVSVQLNNKYYRQKLIIQ